MNTRTFKPGSRWRWREFGVRRLDSALPGSVISQRMTEVAISFF